MDRRGASRSISVGGDCQNTGSGGITQGRWDDYRCERDPFKNDYILWVNVNSSPPPPPPPPPPVRFPAACGIIAADEGLLTGQAQHSCDGRFTLRVQSDGNLVLYWEGVRALWASNTRSAGGEAIMQGDGNFVLYATNGAGLWSSRTSGHPGARLAVQNDGNVVLYTEGWTPIWATNTCCH